MDNANPDPFDMLTPEYIMTPDMPHLGGATSMHIAGASNYNAFTPMPQ